MRVRCAIDESVCAVLVTERTCAGVERNNRAEFLFTAMLHRKGLILAFTGPDLDTRRGTAEAIAVARLNGLAMV